MSDKPKVMTFDPAKTCDQEYPITSFQPIYFAADSFDDAKAKLRYTFDYNDKIFIFP